MALSDSSTRTCPTDAELENFHACELDTDEQARIEQHLQQCAACAARAAWLLSDHNSWVSRVRAAGPPPAERFRPDRPDAAPSDVPGYTLGEELRRGGQGIIYRAVQLSTKREVVLKVLREGRLASTAARRRFEREVEIVASLSHPHIVTIFDSGRTRDGHLFFAMDFIRGRRLDQYISETNPPLRARLELFAQICAAVNYAHQRGVIHRDLKPANVLVDDAGEPHVLDFGLARQLTQDAAGLTTLPGYVPGTLPYLSPEQARGLPDAVDVRSDVYALGVMLYEILTGAYPRDLGSDLVQALKQIAEGMPRSPRRQSAAAPGPDVLTSRVARAAAVAVDDELETVVLKALAPERQQRYQTSGDLGRDVEHVLAGEPIEARRDSGWYQLRKTLWRYRTAVGLILAFVALLSASAISLALAYREQVKLRQESEHQTELARAAKNVAQDRFEQLRRLASQALFNIDPKLAPLPGAAPARELIVTESLKYLSLLAEDAQGNPNLQHELAAAYVTVGDVQGDLNGSSLGDVRGALASYQEARRLLEAGLAARPDFVKPRTTLLLTLLKIGDVQRVLGARDQARTAYDECIALGTQALADDPQNTTIRGDVAVAHERIGALLARLGQFDEALDWYHKCVELSAGLPNDADTYEQVHARISALTHIGEIEVGRGNLSEALAAYEEADNLSQDALRRFPGNLIAQRTQATTQQWLGIVNAAGGNHPQALIHYRESLRLTEAAILPGTDSDPNRVCLTRTCIKLGESQMALQEHGAALDTFRRAQAAAEKVYGRHPDWADHARLLGVVYYKLAEIDLARAGDEQLAAAERSAAFRSAANWLGRCRNVFLDMRDREILSPADAGVPDDLATEIEQYISQARELEPAAPTSQSAN